MEENAMLKEEMQNIKEKINAYVQSQQLEGPGRVSGGSSGHKGPF